MIIVAILARFIIKLRFPTNIPIPTTSRFSFDFVEMLLQGNFHIADSFGTNAIVRCREVSAVGKCHYFHTVFGTEIFVHCLEVSVV